MSSPASISAKNFYSKNKNARQLEIEEKVREQEASLMRNPLPPELKCSLYGPPKVWQVFNRQEEALEFAWSKGEGLMTFAFEERVPESQGRRKYMVTHPSHLWAIHYRRPAEQRCTYEVIASGSPCKLYMDLEFNKILNPLCDGNKMTNILVRATVWLFQELFDLTLSPSDVLILDACTASKFSQHLIFQTGCIAFQDNIHAGSFVKHLVSLLKDGKIPILEPEDQQSLFVRNSEGSNSNDVPPTSSFCDLAVYTKNRNFRLFLSSKFGKNVPLLVSSTNLYVPDSQGFSDADEAIFYSSLVSLINPGIGQLLSFTGDVVDRPYSSAPSMRALVDSTSLPSSSGLVSRSSPWVEIDRFVDSLVLPFGGSIRQWIYYEKSQTVVYLIQGSRYCSVIGRHHKSNSVKYVVNLTHGTYYQSCFDPDCAPMRPSPQPIPAEHLPWSNLLQSPE